MRAVFVCLLALSCCTQPLPPSGQSHEGKPASGDFDVKITGGSIIDGSGKPPFFGDLGIRGDSIVAMGDRAKDIHPARSTTKWLRR